MTDSSPPEGADFRRNPEDTATGGAHPCTYAGGLGVEHRRHVVEALAEHTTALELGELAAEIVTPAPGADPPPKEAIAGVKLGLHHVHLPTLDQMGVLDYDPTTRVITPTGTVGSTHIPESNHGWSTSLAALRGWIVTYFDESSGETASVDDLTRFAVTQSADTHEWPAERVRLLLHHAVLPKMDDDGVIDYHRRTKTVRVRADSS